MATAHSKCSEESRQFCDDLLAAMQVLDPTTDRGETGMCGFFANNKNRFAYLEHKSSKKIARIYIRGYEDSQLSKGIGLATVSARSKIINNGWTGLEGFEKEFPYHIDVPHGTSFETVAQFILEHSYPLADTKRKSYTSDAERLNDIELTDGKVRTVLSTQYERNQQLREQCLKIHGYRCAGCDLLMSERYGPIAEKFIHVHHIERLADTGERVVDPKTDLIPLCPNCHAVVHLSNPPLRIAEVRKSCFDCCNLSKQESGRNFHYNKDLPK